MRSQLVGVALLILVATSGGCNRSQMPALHPVRGIVTRGNQPVKFALVRLEPTQPIGEGEFTISGISDDQGNAVIETIEIKTNRKLAGAPEGAYTVKVQLPMGDDQSGGGEFDVPNMLIVKAGENILPIDVPKK